MVLKSFRVPFYDFAVNFYNNAIGAKALFAAGLLITPALVFNPSAEHRVFQFLFFWFLARLCGKKTNFIFTIFITTFIVLFNLIIPYGRVLFSFGFFKITSGALEAGIHRAVTLQALVMLSKASVRQDLKLPGAFGRLLGESTRVFSVLMSGKYRLSAKNFMIEIDNLMLELSREELSGESGEERKTKPAGYIVLTITVIASWFPWILAYL